MAKNDHYKKRYREEVKRDRTRSPKPELKDTREVWERFMDKLAEMAVACIDPVLKTVTTFAILIASIFALIFSAQVPYLPHLIVIGVVFAIVGLWRSGNRVMMKEDHNEILRLKEELKDLHNELSEYDERIGNIEVLESFEDRLAQKELEKNKHMVSAPSFSSTAEKQSSSPDTPPPFLGN